MAGHRMEAADASVAVGGLGVDGDGRAQMEGRRQAWARTVAAWRGRRAGGGLREGRGGEGAAAEPGRVGNDWRGWRRQGLMAARRERGRRG
jgi:hypothetical protein